jgi:hypothetical protein
MPPAAPVISARGFAPEGAVATSSLPEDSMQRHAIISTVVATVNSRLA